MNDGWHCGVCGRPEPDCQCGDPLLLVIRIPDLTAGNYEHTEAARDIMDALNQQRYEQWIDAGGASAKWREVRLLASAWLNETITEDTDG